MDYSSDSENSNSEPIDTTDCENLYDYKQSEVEEIIKEFEETKEDYENKLVSLLERYKELEKKKHQISFCGCGFAQLSMPSAYSSCHYDDYDFEINYEHQKVCYKIEEYQKCISEIDIHIKEFILYL